LNLIYIWDSANVAWLDVAEPPASPTEPKLIGQCVLPNFNYLRTK
jgi:hypothetical protein